jgi:hypothetical protein
MMMIQDQDVSLAEEACSYDSGLAYKLRGVIRMVIRSRVSTSAPVNVDAHVPALADPRDRFVIRSNDTLCTVAHLDVARQSPISCPPPPIRRVG